MTLKDVEIGDTIKLNHHGVKWTVEAKREPNKIFRGYVALRSPKGTHKVIGDASWIMPVTIIARAAIAKAQGV